MFTNLPLALGLTIVTFVTFHAFPSIDIDVSKLFYDGHFWLTAHPFIKFIHKSVFYVSYFIYIYTFIYFIIYRSRSLLLKLGAFLLTYALVPGVFVNSLLKAHWGRPRPNQVDLFGGGVPFHKVPLLPTGLGEHYPGYVSGHAALAFFVCMIGLFVDQKRQSLWLGIGFSYWVVVSFVRVAEGGHFLSDVLLAGCYVWSLSLMSYFAFSRFWSNK